MSGAQPTNGEQIERTTGEILGSVDTSRESQDVDMLAEKERTKITDTYWPTIKKTLMEDPSARECLDIECAICWEPITVRDDDHATEDLDMFGGTTHEACVLPCGHILGLSCMKKMSVNDWEEAKDSHCPYCRFSLHHERCMHHVAKPVIDWNNLDRMSLTIPEGGELKTDCMVCTLDSMGHSLAQAVELLHPDSFDNEMKIGVRISAAHSLEHADYQYSFTTNGFSYESSPHTLPGNPFQALFDKILESFRSENQNSWVFADPRSIRIELALYQRTYEEDEGDQEGDYDEFGEFMEFLEYIAQDEDDGDDGDDEDDEDDRDESERENDASQFDFTPFMHEDMRG